MNRFVLLDFLSVVFTFHTPNTNNKGDIGDFSGIKINKGTPQGILYQNFIANLKFHRQFRELLVNICHKIVKKSLGVKL